MQRVIHCPVLPTHTRGRNDFPMFTLPVLVSRKGDRGLFGLDMEGACLTRRDFQGPGLGDTLWD